MTFLFRRYRYSPPQAYVEDVRGDIDGVTRLSAQAMQAGEGNIWDGDRPLTWALYKYFNTLFLEMGDADGAFASAFSKLTVNLACRGKNTGQICVKQMKWQDDYIEIPFAHSKDSQRADKSIKKLPRSLYCNPLEHDSVVSSALFDYMALNPDVLANPEGSLFSGSVDAQAQRFSKIVTRLKNKHAATIKRVYGFDIEDIGVHSWRKCAHTKLNTGSTAGPSAAAACIRGGHSLGANRDVYIAQSQASDNFCGRVLAGLPEHDPSFAVAYPDFIGIDAERSLDDEGVSSNEVAALTARINDKVQLVLYSIFGEEKIHNFLSFVPILRVGLASHLMHREHYMEHLPVNATLKTTPLFTNPLVMELKRFVHIAMPWEE
jgi:hypothetical protein